MPKVSRGSKRNDVERRIHFYRSYCGKDEAGKPLTYKQGTAVAKIKSLPFTDSKAGGRYFEDAENVYCCWVESPSKLKFAVIRRDAFPQLEEKGIVKALNVPATAGLVEQIHVRFFPKNVVGFDFNFYGPRLSRLATYLNQVGKSSPKVAFFPLLRQDTAAELAGNKDLRVFDFRVHRSLIDLIEESDKDLAKALRTTAGLSSADEVQLILRPKPFSRDSMGTKMMKVARKLAKRKDIREVASEFKVKVSEPGKAAVDIDLLGDHFIFERRILKQSKRGRALDAADAFANIGDAYEERRQELESAAALAPQ